MLAPLGIQSGVSIDPAINELQLTFYFLILLFKHAGNGIYICAWFIIEKASLVDKLRQSVDMPMA
jgi:hypothetical protein